MQCISVAEIMGMSARSALQKAVLVSNHSFALEGYLVRIATGVFVYSDHVLVDYRMSGSHASLSPRR